MYADASSDKSAGAPPELSTLNYHHILLEILYHFCFGGGKRSYILFAFFDVASYNKKVPEFKPIFSLQIENCDFRHLFGDVFASMPFREGS